MTVEELDRTATGVYEIHWKNSGGFSIGAVGCELQQIGFTLPAMKRRVETGAVQFGDDWRGLFIRGDDCMALNLALNALLKIVYDGRPTPETLSLARIADIQEIIETNVIE